MHRNIRLTSVGFALFCLILSGSINAGEPPPPNLAGTVQKAYCMSGYLDYNDPNAYFSAVFDVRVPQNAKPSYPQDLAKIYESYLNLKYGYVRTGPLSVICTLQNIVRGAGHSGQQGHPDKRKAVLPPDNRRDRMETVAATGGGRRQRNCGAQRFHCAASESTIDDPCLLQG